MKGRIHIVLMLAIALISCRKDDIPTELSGTEFVPLNVGSYYIYDVTKVVYSPDYNYTDTLLPGPNYIDTLHYQIKEELSETDIDLEGNEFFKIRRYIRNNDSEDWKIDSMWKCQVNGPNFIRTENNINYIRLNFPVELGRVWDGNAMNILELDECKDYTYDHFTTFYNNNLYFENVAVVIGCSDTTDPFVKQRKEIEYYAENVGLVYRIHDQFSFCNPASDTAATNCYGKGIIDNGFFYEQIITDYHIEP